MPGKDLIEAGPSGTAKVWSNERADDVIRLPRDIAGCFCTSTVAQHAAARGGKIRLRVGEALVDTAADDDHVATLPQPAHQLIADLEVMILEVAVALQPQEGPVEACTRQGVRKRSVDVDADLEAASVLIT
jgi:hypothetical protein